MSMSCPTAQVSSWEGHRIHFYKTMPLFPFLCLWPLPQRRIQTPQFPPCRQQAPVVRSPEAISAPGWISLSSSVCPALTNFDQSPTIGLHIRPCWTSKILFFTPFWMAALPQTYWGPQFVDVAFHVLLQVGWILTKLLNRYRPLQ